MLFTYGSLRALLERYLAPSRAITHAGIPVVICDGRDFECANGYVVQLNGDPNQSYWFASVDEVMSVIERAVGHGFLVSRQWYVYSIRS